MSSRVFGCLLCFFSQGFYQADDGMFSFFFQHPGYMRASNFPNDIALLQLDEPVDVTGRFVRHACLPDREFELGEDWNCWISGWGETRGLSIFLSFSPFFSHPLSANRGLSLALFFYLLICFLTVFWCLVVSEMSTWLNRPGSLSLTVCLSVFCPSVCSGV